MAKEEWESYKVGQTSSQPNWSAQTCRPFDKVSHVGHVDHALRIVADKKIRQNLISDASKLNTARVLVVWLSPNHWGNGFRYGNIAFTYDFAKLIRDKNYYWVEAMTDYSPAACRILITAKDRSTMLNAYDPKKRDGPWWYDVTNDAHYFNNTHCLEFMIEADLPLKDAARVDFVKHHPDMCSVHKESPKSCPENDLSEGHGGARFIATAAARSLKLSSLAKSLVTEDGKLSHRVKSALAGMLPRRFSKQSFAYAGKVSARTVTGEAVARALLNALTTGKPSDADLIAGLFRSDDSVMRAVSAVVAETLAWPETTDILKALGD
ncbi:MAG: hypothetical protein JF606_24365 [Burkholderiales bacterium]|nr:hypothetical protein [Burkholderiales bacterium]